MVPLAGQPELSGELLASENWINKVEGGREGGGIRERERERIGLKLTTTQQRKPLV